MSESDKFVRIAIDAMGGDFAPEEIIKGAVSATKQGGIEAILVGTKDAIDKYLSKSSRDWT